MRLLAACAVVVALSGCTFAQKHPAVTAGILCGSVGFTACAIDNASMKTCGIIGGSTALFLGGITAIVTLLFDTSDHSLPSDEPEEPEIIRRHMTQIDAGIPQVSDAAITDAAITDAGMTDAVAGDAVLSPSP